MKKKFAKKLSLKKETISILQNDEMRLIKGASIILPSCDCDTASCSIAIHCCDPETEEILLNREKTHG